MKLTAAALGMGVAILGMLPDAAKAAGEEINLYSTREPALINPALDAFTKATGIRVNVAHIGKGVIERLKAEGANSPADAVLTVDIGMLHDLDQAGVLQPATTPTLAKNVAAHLRHPQNLWHALTYRARVFYTSKDRIMPGEAASYEALTATGMKGRVCTRSGKQEYNVSLIASVIAHKGYEGAKKWLNGVKLNLAQKPQGNDRSQAKAIMEGICDVALANTYYFGLMSTNTKEPAQQKWAQAVKVVFPNQADRGTHVNVSGMGITKSAKHKANAIKLLEFLSEAEAQQIYSQKNFEYPVKPGVKTDPLIDGLGKFKIDSISLLEVAKNRGAATRLVDDVGFDQYDPRS